MSRNASLGKYGRLPLLILTGIAFMDWADQAAYNVLLPDIRDSLHLSDTGILAVVAVAGAASLLLTVPIAWLADRTNRVHLALVGAAVWGAFSLSTGLATFVVMLVIVRSGAAIGQAVVFPTHNSLLADYYPIDQRPKVYAFHQGGNVVGQLVGVLAGAGLAEAFGWRAPFVVFAIPVLLLVVVGLRLREPERGVYERAAGAGEEGLSEEAEAAGVAEPPPSYAEAYRMVWKIATLRRIFLALPFLASSLIGFASLAALQYDRTFGLDATQRGWTAVPVLLVQVVGLLVGARLAARAAQDHPARIFRVLAGSSIVASAAAAGFAAAPNVALAVAAQCLIAAALAIVGPGVLAALSLAVPPRARAIGFSIGALFILPGLVVLPLVGWIGHTFGLRWGLAMMTPVFVLGGLCIASVGRVVDADIADVWTATATRAELLAARARGDLKQLLVRKLDVRYGDVRVLFDVDIEIAEGEIVALLGTNGAGKSTLLGAIAGTVEASNGAIVFEGRDITHAPPEEIARYGIAQVPGGKGVFPSLTVAENLRVSSWQVRRDGGEADRRRSKVLELFPVLAERLNDPAADLSGGQQQMLALGMALVSQPKLLVIDELSLGLSPIVVDELLEVVRAIRDGGTTVIVVEQSVNVALTLADRAYFMEKGEIRFRGDASELLAQPELLRSVYLAGAGAGLAVAEAEPTEPPDHAGAVGLSAAESASRVGDLGGARVTSHGQVPGRSVPPALEVRGLRVAFGGITAVDDVHLACAPGEILGVIGPNGAGKTTLFDLVSGLTPADAGDVHLGAADVTGHSAAARARAGLGRSFQDSRLFESLTVVETLAVALERWIEAGDALGTALATPAVSLTEAAVRARTAELVELFGLGAFRSKLLGELSTGSRRIVDLACVVAHQPTVVLLDEPSSGIAQREAEALGPLLLRLRDHLGATLLVVEHDLALVTSVADRLVAMDQGQVVIAGPAAEVLAHPRVVDAYLGSGSAARHRSGTQVPQPQGVPS